MSGLARRCATRPWTVIVLWLVVLLGAGAVSRVLGTTYSDNFSLPGSSSQTGLDLLADHLPSSGGYPSPIVFRGDLDAHRDAVDSTVEGLRGLAHVTSVTAPDGPPSTRSTDGHTAYATVRFDQNPTQVGPALVDAVDVAVRPARRAGLQVDYGATLGQAARPAANDRLAETVGLTVAVGALLVAFGSVLAAGVTVAGAVSGTIVGLGLVAVLGSVVSLSTLAPTLAIMLGLGVGLDYALFTTTRFRQLVIDGVDPVDAVVRTVVLSTRTVVVAASLVVAALLCLFASGAGFIGRLGLSAGLAVACAPLATLTLVPALLGLAGRRIDQLRVRRPVAEPTRGGDGWARYATYVGQHPWSFLLGGLLLLLVLALPVATIRIGHIDAGGYPVGFTDRRAYDALSQAYGPGSNAPLTVVVETGGTGAADLASRVSRALRTAPGVASVAPAVVSPDGVVLVTTVIPTTGPSDAATADLVDELAGDVLPGALRGTAAQAYLTGSTAAQLEFKDLVARHLPWVIAAVAAITLVVLLLTFRSVLVAVKAVLLNLISIGAAYGTIVVLFQWGWGVAILGLSEPVAIQTYVPIVIFAIVFGLSIDYEVFLLSRIYEAWNRTGDNHGAVVEGLSSTARVISTAAVTMTAVFLAFLTSDSVVVKMISVGLGASVVVDATVVRLVVVPAAMYLFRSANWWIPRWLDRAMPSRRPSPAASELVDRPGSLR